MRFSRYNAFGVAQTWGRLSLSLSLLLLTLTHCVASVDPDEPDVLSGQDMEKSRHAGTITQWRSTCNSGSVPWRIGDSGPAHLSVTYHVFANSLGTFSLNSGAEFLVVAIPERDNAPLPQPWIGVKLNPETRYIVTQDDEGSNRIAYTVYTVPDAIMANISMREFSLQATWIRAGLRRRASVDFSIRHRSVASAERGGVLYVGADAKFSCPRTQVPQIQTRVRALVSHNIQVIQSS